MYLTIWEFFVRPGSEGEFERIYGPKGDWARLFAGSAGYLGTELLLDNEQNGPGATRYVTIDRWSGARVFANFQAARGEKYKELDARCERLTARETRMGSFESK
jgi:heme-degrading monooxygenase HmoA